MPFVTTSTVLGIGSIARPAVVRVPFEGFICEPVQSAMVVVARLASGTEPCHATVESKPAKVTLTNVFVIARQNILTIIVDDS